MLSETESRGSQRFAWGLSADCDISGVRNGKHEHVRAQVVNISKGGSLLKLKGGPRLGSYLHMAIDLPNGARLVASGLIIRQEKGRAAVRFGCCKLQRTQAARVDSAAAD